MSGLAEERRNSSSKPLPVGDFPIAELAANQDGLVASWQLKALGYDRHSIGYRRTVGRLHAVYRGVYAVGHGQITPRGRLRAALLAYGPDAILSHRSAAAFWGIRPTAQANVDVTVPGSNRSSRRGINLHRARALHPDEVTTHHTMPITSIARTALDIAATFQKPHLTRALEQADRLELLDLRAIDQACDRYPNHAGRRPLLAAVRNLREPPQTRSELERRFLDIIRAAGLPEPGINVQVAGYEVDFHWPRQRLIVELDGYAFHKHRGAFERDRAKDIAFQRAKQRVVRLTHLRLNEPDAVVSDVEAFLRPPRA
jgi:very-short-patch-repair endonuclease